MTELPADALAALIALSEPLNIRTIAFDVPTFDRLKDVQRWLERRLRRDTSNAQVLRYLVHTHPATQPGSE